MAFTDFLARRATWKTTIILLLAQFIVQGLILFGAYPLIGGRGYPLDMRSGMSVAEVREYAAGIDPDGRRIYALNEGTLDMLFPILYSLAYSFLFFRLIVPMAGDGSRWRLLALLPFAVAAVDIGENLSIIGVLAAAPGARAWPQAVIFFNAVKGFLMTATIAALLLLIVMRLAFLVFKRGGPQTAG